MRNPDRQTVFHFKQFDVFNRVSAMKVGTDSVLLGAWAFASVSSETPWRVLDAGCGTGLLALMIAQRFPAAKIEGVDIDAGAVGEATTNFLNSPWHNRLHAIHADFMSHYVKDDTNGCNDRYNLIISNPPYFTNGALAPDQSRANARHEQGGFGAVTAIMQGSRILSEQGRIALIAPRSQLDDIKFQAALSGLQITRLCHISTVKRKEPCRVMVELENTGNPKTARCTISEEQLIIHDANNPSGYSRQYRQLTSPFYLHF